jgi:hypothetical protein
MLSEAVRSTRRRSPLLRAPPVLGLDLGSAFGHLRDSGATAAVNAIRTEFFAALALDPLPASTALHARFSRNDLPVKMDLTRSCIRGSRA